MTRSPYWEPFAVAAHRIERYRGMEDIRPAPESNVKFQIDGAGFSRPPAPLPRVGR
jgi:hypothetical protein